MITGRLHDRASAVRDRCAGRLPQPGGHPVPGRDLRHLLGERPARATALVTVPAAFTPP
jgi:hypothetical protein